MLFIGDFTAKMVPKGSAKVMYSVPKHKAAMMYFMWKIPVLDKIHSGIVIVLFAMSSI